MRVVFESAKIAFLINRRYYLNYLFNVISAVFSFVPYFLVTILFEKQPKQSIVWVALGGIVWIILSQLIWSIGLSVREEIEEGTLEQLLLAPNKEMLVFFGKSIPVIFLSITSSIITLSILTFMLGERIEKTFLVMLLIMSCVPMAVGLSMLIALMVIRFKEVFAFLQVLMVIFTVLFGITYPIEYLPEPMKKISNILLIPKIIDDIRSIYLKDIDVFCTPIIIDIILTFILGIILFIVSLYLLKKSIKKMKEKGSYVYI